MTSYDFICVIA